MPEISPTEEIDKPTGRPVAENESGSESGSENADVMGNEICDSALEVRLPTEEKTGDRFGGSDI